MKKLDRFILTSFIGPFFALLFIVLFILMMQFLWLYIDELVGKGLGMGVILEFMAWGGCTLLPLSLPLATLLASVMTLGQLSENNELIAMKSAGISLKRVMTPMVVVSALISIAAFFAANDLVPLAYKNIYTLRDDIGRTKEEIKIPTGTFYDGLEGYTLRVDSRNRKTGMMYNVQVYDHSSGKGDISMTLADSAVMKMSEAKDYITFRLFSGINYQETNKMQYRDTSLELQRISFDVQTLIIPLQNYAFEKSDANKYADQVRSMNLSRLARGRDSLQHVHDSTVRNIRKNYWTRRNLKYLNQLDTSKHFTANVDMDFQGLTFSSLGKESKAIDNAVSAANEMSSSLSTANDDMAFTNKILRHTRVEYLKKFALALACLILFFIGAPLGSFVTKKTGLGAAAIVAVLFFVLYWVIDITGTKLAKDGAASAMTGAFISTMILLPLGLFLSWKAVNDAKLFGANDSLAASWRAFKSKVMRIFKKTRIVYMGTPEFAVAPLKALIDKGYKVVGVVTVADKPSGRGLKVTESAVKKFAVEQGLPVLQPVKLKDPEFLEQLAALKADIFVVAPATANTIAKLANGLADDMLSTTFLAATCPKLISPAMNYGTLAGYSDPIKWLDEFFEQPNVSLDDVYAISIHCYMGSAGAMAAFVQKFAKYNKPIWLTEFCAWENVNSVEAQMDYMSAALNYLETTELVERYAWFIPRWSKHNVSPYMELLTSGVESSLTDAGKVYCYFTNMSSSEYLETNRFIYAGEYCTLSNTNTTLRPCADAEAVLKAGKEGLMVSGLHTGNALTYHLAVPQFTNTITIRYASYIASIMEIYVDGQLANYLDMPKTGSYDNWTEAMTTAGIKAGYHEIELKMNSGSAYISGFLLQ